MSCTHQESPSDEAYKANIALSYEYLNKSVTEIKSNIDSINTKLGLIVGFNATFIRFSSGLPNQTANLASGVDNYLVCYSCLILKIFFCIFLSLSMGIAVWGLFPVKVITTLTPTQLLEKAKLASENDYKLAIIYLWEKIMPDLLKIRDEKSTRLRWSLVLFAVAVSLSVLDVIIASIYKA